MRCLILAVTMVFLGQIVHADYWSLVETTTKVRTPAPNDMMQGSIEGSGSGMTSRLVNPSYWVQKGGTFETSAQWSAPPAVLIPGRKIRLNGAIDVQRNGLNSFEITNFLRLGGHRGRIDTEQLSTEENIFTAAVTTKGAQRDSKSGEWQVPDLSAGQIWITAYVIGAGTRAVIYSYRPVSGEPPPAGGARTVTTQGGWSIAARVRALNDSIESGLQTGKIQPSAAEELRAEIVKLQRYETQLRKEGGLGQQERIQIDSELKRLHTSIMRMKYGERAN